MYQSNDRICTQIKTHLISLEITNSVYLFRDVNEFDISSRNHEIIKCMISSALINENHFAHCYVHKSGKKLI